MVSTARRLSALERITRIGGDKPYLLFTEDYSTFIDATNDTTGKRGDKRITFTDFRRILASDRRITLEDDIDHTTIFFNDRHNQEARKEMLALSDDDLIQQFRVAQVQRLQQIIDGLAGLSLELWGDVKRAALAERLKLYGWEHDTAN